MKYKILKNGLDEFKIQKNGFDMTKDTLFPYEESLYGNHYTASFDSLEDAERALKNYIKKEKEKEDKKEFKTVKIYDV